MKNYVLVTVCLVMVNAHMGAMGEWPVVNKNEIILSVDDVNDQGEELLEMGEVTLVRNSSPRVCVKRDKWIQLEDYLTRIAIKTGSKKACLQIGYICKCFGNDEGAKKWFGAGKYVVRASKYVANDFLSNVEDNFSHGLFVEPESETSIVGFEILRESDEVPCDDSWNNAYSALRSLSPESESDNLLRRSSWE